jgi:hypothetical protein
MLSLTIHCVQILGEWKINATLCRDLGSGLPPEVSSGESHLPLTDWEWDSDDLTAVLSAISRWSGMTIEAEPKSRLD